MNNRAQWSPGSINWRPGSWRPYESLACIGAKFCYLNKVTIQTYLEFLSDFIGSPKKTAAGEHRLMTDNVNSILDSPSFQLRAYARVFEEPVRIVRTSQLSALIPNRVVAPILTLTRVCQECIKDGYHAVFHQMPWFNKCLIHGTVLIDFKFEMPSHPKNYRQISVLQDALFGKGSTWAYPSFSAWIPSHGQSHFRVVASYKRLLRELGDKTFLSQQSTVSLKLDQYQVYGRLPNVEELLSCVSKLVPASTRVVNSLLEQRIETNPKIYEFNIQHLTADTGWQLLDGFHMAYLSELINLRIIEREINKDSPDWWLRIEENFSRMIKRHANCVEAAVNVYETPLVEWAQDRFPAIGSVCPRVSLALRFDREWRRKKVAPPRRYRIEANWRSSWLLPAGEILSEKGFTSRSQKQMRLADENGKEKDYEISFWELKAPWRELCDYLILDVVLGACWQLFESEKCHSAGCEQVPILSKEYFPIVSFERPNETILRVSIWRRTLAGLPNWEELESNATDHRLAVHAWHKEVDNSISTAVARNFEKTEEVGRLFSTQKSLKLFDSN